jgi:hypothetical protein
MNLTIGGFTVFDFMITFTIVIVFVLTFAKQLK